MQIRKIEKDKHAFTYYVRDLLCKYLFQHTSYHRRGEEKCLEDKVESLLSFQAQLVETMLKKGVLDFGELLGYLDVPLPEDYILEI